MPCAPNATRRRLCPSFGKSWETSARDLSESDFHTMDQVVEDSFGSQMLAARLLEIFAGSALLLSVAGIYALLAYLVVQRTREMGLRIALGAQRSQVMRLILRQAAWMLVIGLAIGAVLAYFGSRALRSFLYGVQIGGPVDAGGCDTSAAGLRPCRGMASGAAGFAGRSYGSAAGGVIAGDFH